MKPPAEFSRNFSRLLKQITKARLPEPPAQTEPVDVLVMSFLLWDSTTTKAAGAYKRVCDRVVDFNDLRVTMPKEIVEFIGPRYPMALERAERLRAALRDTYSREHAMSLNRLFDLGKRDAKKYLRSLDGIAPYVADRVTLLCFDGNCIPVDERLRRSLAHEGVCEEAAEIGELATWLSRHVKAADAAGTHCALQQWSDRIGGARRSTAARGSSARKTRSRAAASR